MTSNHYASQAGETADEGAAKPIVTCRHCRRVGVKNLHMIPTPVPGMRFEYECRDYQQCIDRARPEQPSGNAP